MREREREQDVGMKSKREKEYERMQTGEEEFGREREVEREI